MRRLIRGVAMIRACTWLGSMQSPLETYQPSFNSYRTTSGLLLQTRGSRSAHPGRGRPSHTVEVDTRTRGTATATARYMACTTFLSSNSIDIQSINHHLIQTRNSPDPPITFHAFGHRHISLCSSPRRDTERRGPSLFFGKRG
jgi:hypothetical protein